MDGDSTQAFNEMHFGGWGDSLVSESSDCNMLISLTPNLQGPTIQNGSEQL